MKLNPRLALYAFIARVRPLKKSYIAKIMLVAFIGTHVPLVTLLASFLISSSDSTRVTVSALVIALLATLAGTAATICALYYLLAPVVLTSKALQDYLKRKRLPELPTEFVDEAGRLMAQTSQTLNKLDELIQAEKMSSLGKLVAGVTHEINNPVSFIYGNLTPAKQYAEDLTHLIHLYQKHYPAPPQEILAYLEEADIEYTLKDFPALLTSMKTGATRIQTIVQSLRTFSHLDETGRKAIDLHQNIDSILTLLQNHLDNRVGHPAIEVAKHYGDLPLVECYGSLLNQALMNLLMNAIEAIEARQHQGEVGYAGCITVKTTARADRVLIFIQDNGIGIRPEIQAKIFNPFFTTKSVGQGIGMGLSIGYQIVTSEHHGALRCRSVPGQGSEFIVELGQPIGQLPSVPALG